MYPTVPLTTGSVRTVAHCVRYVVSGVWRMVCSELAGERVERFTRGLREPLPALVVGARQRCLERAARALRHPLARVGEPLQRVGGDGHVGERRPVRRLLDLGERARTWPRVC